MAARGIKLRRYAIQNANHWYLHGYRIRIEVIATAGDMPRDVFVYRRSPPDPYTGDCVPDTFMTVASFPDIAEYPPKNPSSETKLPFFRDDYVELDVKSTRDYECVWTTIQKQVATLVNILNLADGLVMEEEVWFGNDVSDINYASDTSDASDDYGGGWGGGGGGGSGTGLVWKGDWSVTAAYAVGNVVYYGGSSYVCVAANTGAAITNETYWNLMAAGGSGSSDTISVAGSDTEVQFNDAGLQAGNPALTFVKGTGTLAATLFSGSGADLTDIPESGVSGLTAALALLAPLASPTFTGVPAGPTAALGDNSTQLATTAFVYANDWYGW